MSKVRLDALKKERLLSETREARIQRALAALQSGPKLRLSADQWKDAAENAELDEEQ